MKDQFDKSRIVVFDVETTGLRAGHDEMLQFSCCNGYGEKLLNTYLRPMHHTKWPDAEEINGITPAMVSDAPTVKDVRDKIQSIFDQADLIVAYNGAFDVRFLRAAGINPYANAKEMYDVMLQFAPIYGEWNDYFESYRWQKLTTAAEYYGYKWEEYGAHDSMGDVLATLFVYDKLIENEKAVR